MRPLLRVSYSVPPSVHIRFKVAPVANGAPSVHACFSISFNSASGVYETSHLLPVWDSYSARISAGVAVKELTIRVAFLDAAGCVSAATTRVPTLGFESGRQCAVLEQECHCVRFA